MTVLVVAECDAKGLKESTSKVVSAALAVSGDVDVLVAGTGVRDAARAASAISGVRKVLLCDSPVLEGQTAEVLEALIVPFMDAYGAVIFAATTTGKNAAPRVAASLDVMQVSGIVSVEAPDVFVRPIYAGNALVTVRDSQTPKVLTIQPTAFEPAGQGGSAPIEEVALPEGPFGTRFISEEVVALDRPELTEAARIVSGGRALGSAEEFSAMIEPVADRLGAAIGASRAAVDAGYAPNDYQVGQTGKIVAPELYVAVGISGAIQHIAGMKDSKTIVAINNDPDAPIFQIADYGLVEDYRTAIPQLLKELDATA